MMQGLRAVSKFGSENCSDTSRLCGSIHVRKDVLTTIRLTIDENQITQAMRSAPKIWPSIQFKTTSLILLL